MGFKPIDMFDFIGWTCKLLQSKVRLRDNKFHVYNKSPDGGIVCEVIFDRATGLVYQDNPRKQLDENDPETWWDSMEGAIPKKKKVNQLDELLRSGLCTPEAAKAIDALKKLRGQ